MRLSRLLLSFLLLSFLAGSTGCAVFKKARPEAKPARAEVEKAFPGAPSESPAAQIAESVAEAELPPQPSKEAPSPAKPAPAQKKAPGLSSAFEKLLGRQAEGATPERPAIAASAEAGAPPSLEAKEITLNFQNADLLTVLQMLAPRLGLDYVVEPSVPGGRVTIQISGKFTNAELFRILLTLLEMNNLMMVKSGPFYRIAPLAEARQRPIELLMPSDPEAIPPEDRPAFLVISLQHLPASSVEPVIRPLISKAAMLQVVPGTNALFLVDTGSNARRLFELIQLLDTPVFDRYQVELYEVKHANPDDLASELEGLFAELGYGKGKDQLLKFLPITRLGSVLVINGFPQLRSQIERWLEALDQDTQGEESIFVYYVENGKASNIASVLTQLYQLAPTGPVGPPGFPPISQPAGLPGRPGAPPPAPRPSILPVPTKPKAPPAQGARRPPPSVVAVGAPPGAAPPGAGPAGATAIPLRIIADDDTNALIIVTNPRFYPTVLETIKKLDIMKRQVVIETLIADISLDDATSFGLEYTIRTTGKVRLGNQVFDFGDVVQNLGALVPGGSLGLSAVVASGNRLSALLQALSEAERVRILASPHVLASDNKPAVIQIGESTPVATSSTSTAQTTGGLQNITSTIQYRDTGVILRVTPHINEKRVVVMDIVQEVSTVEPTTVAGTQTFAFPIRKAETSVVVADGQTVLIGGLIQEERSSIESGVPLLS
ncbi:MAG: type II secretion system secretin GspD, partial [Candidatus Methylomirabilia bacterium]